MSPHDSTPDAAPVDDAPSRRTVLRTGAVLGATALAGMAFAGPARAAGPLTTVRGPSVQLARDGRTRYRILVGPSETVVVHQAATELASYLQEVTGATFPVVVADAPDDDGPFLVLGSGNTVAASPALGLGTTDLGEDGFSLRTLGSSVVIAGTIPRGTLYGTYWVLDHLVGVRWYSADFTVVPRNPSLTLDRALLNGDHVPRFRYRCILSGNGNDPAYRQHNMLNGLRDAYWRAPTPAGIDTWSHYWPEEVGSRGTFSTIVTDPELHHGSQLLFMDPRTRAAATASLVEKVRDRIADGQDASMAFFQNDAGWSPDPDSLAFAAAHGGALSAPMLDMVNDVAARVEAEIPGARLGTQAYQWSLRPPEGMGVADNVVVTVAPITANFGQSLFEGDNAEVGRSITTWTELSANVMVWDYLVNFNAYMQPFPSWWATAAGIRQLATTRAQGYFGEHSNDSSGADFADLRIWVLSRLLWDPSLDVDELIRDFLGGYYGPAAPAVYRYMQLMARSVEETGTYLRTSRQSVGAAYLGFEAIRQADALMSEAAAAVAHDDTYRRHLSNVRLGVDFVALMRRAEFSYLSERDGIGWSPDTDVRMARFESAYTETGVTHWNLYHGTLPSLLELLSLERTYPVPPPAPVQGLPESDWVIFEDYDLYVAAKWGRLAEDSRATDGVAARIYGDRPTWGVQLPLGSLPLEGRWRIYVSVRADLADGADLSSPGLALGVYPPYDSGDFSTETRYPLSALGDGRYHDIELPGTHAWDGARYLYVTGVTRPDVTFLYVDRIFAVRA